MLKYPVFSSPLLSRRVNLGLVTTGFVAALLHACDGGNDSTYPPQDNTESIRQCREAIHKTLSKSDSATTAVSVALLVDDRVVWREAFGHADHDHGLLVTADSRFNIGWVSKFVTALAVMILRDLGQLALDQPLVEWLPSLYMRQPGFERISARHTLSHASGTPRYNIFNVTPIPGYAADTLYALLQSHLKHEPGEAASFRAPSTRSPK